MLAPAEETADPAKPRTDAMLPTLPPNTERGERITRSMAAFIGKNLLPYSVVDNSGFCNMKTLEM